MSLRRGPWAMAIAFLAGRLAVAEPTLPIPSGLAGLTAPEASALARGEAVIRVPESADRLLSPSAPGMAELTAIFRKLRPNYLVEVLALSPAAQGSLPPTIIEALSKPESWVGIPYFSTRKNRVYDLYDLSVTTARSQRADGGSFDARHVMEPFEEYTAHYDFRTGSEGLSFSGSITSPLVYKGVRAVGPGELVWRIIVWRQGGSWLFYGVGGVRAFDLFGAARDRLEPSFIGRTKAFFEFMRGKIVG